MNSLKLGLLCPFLFLLSTVQAQLNKALRQDCQISARTSLQEFRAFLSLPNDAFTPAQLQPNIAWAERAFAKRGFTLRRLPTDGIDLLLAERLVSTAQQTVLFYVQIDGQPVDPSRWDQESPYAPNPQGS